MVIAEVGDDVYNVVLLLHFVFVAVGAGVALVAPLLVTRARRHGGRGVEDFATDAANAVVFPSLLIAGCLGAGLVGLSDDAWDFQQTWLAIAGPIWILSLVLALIANPPKWLNVFNADLPRRRLAASLLQMTLVLLFIDMVWKDQLF